MSLHQPSNASYSILWEEVETAVKLSKKGKLAGVDSIPSELVQAGGEAMIDMLLIICNKVWQTGEWPTSWTQSLIITLSKKGNLQLCQNYCAKTTVPLLNPQDEEIIKEEHTCFRVGRNTKEQIFNLRESVRDTCSTSTAFIMSLWTSRRPSAEFGMQLCGQP